MPRPKPTTSTPSLPTPPSVWPTPALTSNTLRMSYRIGRGEQGVLTFEPYKSMLLPHWRFKSEAIAHQSSRTLHSAFTFYVSAGDFVGADMARKFVQMGMTRAKRYANHKGGRKYDRGPGERVELPRSEGHEGLEEKLAASEVFKEVWRRCTGDEGYVRLKGEFVKELKEWDRLAKKEVKEEVKVEERDAG